MSTAVASSTNSQAQGVRHSVRQTRTNPSRTSKTVGRSSFAFGHSAPDAPSTPAVPHGFYPALTHFTDAITALPREFRRHNSLLKEVDAKAWALEENLQHLLKIACDSQPVPYPPNPAPIIDGVVREDAQMRDSPHMAESQESKNRRLLFDRIRHTLSDLMMTADEKNHVITNANDELDRQLFRLDSIFPYISGEISEESRLGSLTHWAYSNKAAAKDARSTNERPRREAASHKHDAALHEAEAASRSEARREAVLARKHRRNHADLDFDETRGSGARKGAASKARGGTGGDHSVGDGGLNIVNATTAPAKRRKVDRPQPAQAAPAMEQSLSATGNSAGRASSKEAPTTEATKKRIRAPNAAANARKRNNTATSTAGSPSMVSSPVIGTFNPPRNAPSPGPNTAARPQSSRAQQNNSQATNGRQRPSSSASNRVSNSNKPTETKTTAKEGNSKGETASQPSPDLNREATVDVANAATAKMASSVAPKREDMEVKTAEPVQASEPAAPPPPPPGTATKARSSKTSTPAVSAFSESNQPRPRPSRNTDAAAPVKRSHKKSSALAVTQSNAAGMEDEESSREGDDEEDEGEPRYCYCNDFSFGEMVACDNDACPREWFHLSCVGLTKPPGKNVKWYCNECKENMKRGRSAGGK
ncbi:hypothetical protein VTN00DRAFT_10309 [Thermoascus crustaceus]|uniref:uncharacterized protein n=1 Tax=Thermoascus crustaceus TaxID=5088 RepID=UPI00374472E3